MKVRIPRISVRIDDWLTRSTRRSVAKHAGSREKEGAGDCSLFPLAHFHDWLSKWTVRLAAALG